MDCDLRRPTIHKLLALPRANGMAEMLLEGIPAASVTKKTPLETLDVITAGRMDAHPEEVFDAGAIGTILTDLKFYYDMILVDSPPVIPVSDPMLLAPEVDGVLLVIKAGVTQREITRRLGGGRPFCLCYLDLDNLKAFNDYYGYAKADGVISQTGDLIRKAVEKHGNDDDFVGHIAGDDFVLVTRPANIERIGDEIIVNFDSLIPLYYQQEDQERGYIEAEDRFGQMRRFGIMTISLAAVHAEPGTFHTHGEIAARAAELKKQAKAIETSILVQGGAQREDSPGS